MPTESADEANSRRTRPRVLVVFRLAVAALLLGSLALNAGLAYIAWKEYRGGQRLRLTPVDREHFETANHALEPAGDRPRVILFGDSRIHQWIPSPAVQGAQVVNRGIGGETTAQCLLRLDRDVLALNPDVVVLQLGINDLKTIGLFPDREDEIVADCRRNLREIVRRVEEAGARPVVLTIFPVGQVGWLRSPFWSAKTEQAIDSINHEIVGQADLGLSVVDCDEIFRSGGRMDQAFSRDTLHLNRRGYKALNDRVVPILQKFLPTQSAGDPIHAVQ